jgi:hypothetical protein
MSNTRIEENTFAAACYNDCSIDQLKASLKRRAADKSDCAAWNIKPREWRNSIKLALSVKIE